MNRYLLFSIFTFLSFGNAEAQRHEILSEDIASLVVTANDEWTDMPVAKLGQDVINISFDELSHEYHRYTYRLEHCSSDWTVDDGLFASDYIEGIYDNNLIEENRISEGTYQLYTHYSLSFPNEQCRITMSGNYRLSVYDDNEDNSEPVLRACFMISENTASVMMEVSRNTDIDFNGSHQQVGMVARFDNLQVSDPERQLHTVVLQNQRWDSAVRDAHWQFNSHGTLRWDHCRDLIFDAGNEYYKFETLDPTHTTLGLAQVGWDEENREWHAWVVPNYPRPNYLSEQDADGAYLIRNSEYDDPDVLCEYISVHFELNAPKQQTDVYLNGNWTYDSFLPEYRMYWNEVSKKYETTVRLKQGYYSYRYLTVDDEGRIGSVSTEGSFAQTQNTYHALLYYREQGGRTDRLVAVGKIKTD